MRGARSPLVTRPLPLHRSKRSAGQRPVGRATFVLQMEKLRPEISPGHSASERGPGTRTQSSELTLRTLPQRGPSSCFPFPHLHVDLLGSRKLLWTALLAAEGPTEPPRVGSRPLSWVCPAPTSTASVFPFQLGKVTSDLQVPLASCLRIGPWVKARKGRWGSR